MTRIHKDLYTTTEESSQQTIDKCKGFSRIPKQIKILDLCTDIAIGGRPFTFFDTKPVRELVSYALKGSKEAEQSIGSQKVRTSDL